MHREGPGKAGGGGPCNTSSRRKNSAGIESPAPGGGRRRTLDRKAETSRESFASARLAGEVTRTATASQRDPPIFSALRKRPPSFRILQDHMRSGVRFIEAAER